MAEPPSARSTIQLIKLAIGLVVVGALLLGVRSLLWSDDDSSPAAGESSSASGDDSGDPAASTTTTLDPLVAGPPPTIAALPASGGMAPVIERVPTTDRVVFLTIDDGHVRDPDALALLTERGIPFTAFLNLAPAEVGEAFWREAVAAGAMVETHTINHPDLTTLGEAAQREQICGTLDTFEALFGRRPTLFRPPFGRYNSTTRQIANGCGYSGLVMWTGVAANGTLTMQEEVLQPGDVILLHWRETLHDDLEAVIDQVEEQGFQIALLEDYVPPGS